MIGRRLLMVGGGSFALPPRVDLAPTGSAFDVAAGGSYKAFPGLCVMPNGNLLCVYRIGATHVTTDGIIKGTISTDQGATWGAPFTVFDSATDARDPSLLTLDTGRILCSYFEYNGTLGTGVFLVYSDDNAATWSSPVTIPTSYTVEEACSAPIVPLGGSDLMQPVYGRNGTDWESHAVFSHDNGATWSGMVPLGVGGGNDWTEPWVVKVADGRLLCLIRVDNLVKIYGSYSSDAGATWTTPVEFFGGQSRASSILVNTGAIFTLYRKSGADPDGLYRTSLDDGATWSAPGTWTTASFQYAAFAQFPDTTIVGVWAQEASGTDADVYASLVA